MRLTTKFQIASQTKWQLRGLYRVIFNKIADPRLSKADRKSALGLLHLISHHIGGPS